MDATASKVGSVFGEINVAQPFHHPEESDKNDVDNINGAMMMIILEHIQRV